MRSRTPSHVPATRLHHRHPSRRDLARPTPVLDAGHTTGVAVSGYDAEASGPAAFTEGTPKPRRIADRKDFLHEGLFVGRELCWDCGSLAILASSTCGLVRLGAAGLGDGMCLEAGKHNDGARTGLMSEIENP